MLRTVGIEEEFLLVRALSPDLVPAGEAVIASAERHSDGQFEHEFKREQAELGTRPHRSITRLGEDLRRLRGELAAAARAHGARLVASGTSPVDQRTTTTTDDRYLRMTQIFGTVAEVQLTCGMHVHVSIDSAAEGVTVMDGLRRWLPTVLALSANSPYLDGADTGYASFRTILWGAWPTASFGEEFGTPEGYDASRQALIASGAAMDDGMIYFPARLSARYPTVEVRIADVCCDAQDAITIAALLRALVDTAATQHPVAIRSELLRAAHWRAARFGLGSELVDLPAARLAPAWDVVDSMVQDADPALRANGDLDAVRDGLAEIRRRGTGAVRQRALFAAGGAPALIDAVAALTVAS